LEWDSIIITFSGVDLIWVTIDALKLDASHIAPYLDGLAPFARSSTYDYGIIVVEAGVSIIREEVNV
jgi:hypothetical protein